MTQTQEVEAKKASTKPAQQDENTYFIYLADEHETKAARAYLKSLYPTSLAKQVAELRLDRLTDKHTVIALRRDNERTPAVQVIVNPQGVRTLSQTPMAELMKEVQESEPLRCADFWHQRPGGDGELDLARFLEELGKRCTPAAIKYYERTQTLKLGFA